jgi:hypothetical protein
MNNRSQPLLKTAILIIFSLCLIFGLVPLTDTNFNGTGSSFLAEIISLIPVIGGITLSYILVSLFQRIYLNSRPPFFYILVPPPIQ